MIQKVTKGFVRNFQIRGTTVIEIQGERTEVNLLFWWFVVAWLFEWKVWSTKPCKNNFYAFYYEIYPRPYSRFRLIQT